MLSLVCVTATLWLSGAVRCQYRIDAWTTDDGLPQNSVTGLTQTLDGYLWLTTNDGLARFDGLRFTVFNKSNTPEITTNRLSGAFGDKTGRLWFQTEDGAVISFQDGQFSVVLKPNEIPTLNRSPFFNDQQGGVIFYGNDRNYRYVDGKFVPLEVAAIPNQSVVVLADRDGGLWFTDENRVYRLKDGEVENYDLSSLSPGMPYRAAYEDRSGAVWLGYSGKPDGTGDTNLLRIKGGRIRSLNFPAFKVWHFAEDAGGNLWMTGYGRGIYRMDRRFVELDDPPSSAIESVALLDGISASSSGVLVPDEEGGMWIGTEKGLVRFAPRIFDVYSVKNGLTEDDVYPIFQDSSDAVWAGVWQNSLVKFTGTDFTTFLKTKDTFYITSLFEDSAKRLWIGSIDTLRYLERGKLVNFTSQAGFSGYAEFSAITQDRDGFLWFGSSHGLSRYAPDGRATVFTSKDGLPDNYVTALLQTKDGVLYVGTRGGLAAIHGDSMNAFRTESGLASNYVRSLYEDAEGVLWIGSYDGGLTRFEDGRFSRFTVDDGLSSNGVFCILEDERGWLWMNSNQGIFRVARQELNDFALGRTKHLTSIAYNKRDGLLNIEGNGGRQPAGIKSRDGRLWFPTAQGIAVVNPEKVAVNPLPPRVLIEEISVDRKPVGRDAGASAVRGQSKSPVTLKPDDNNLEINYTGLSFVNSEQVRFRYRLAGLEDHWNDVGTRRTAYYSYLPPGEYSFQVIAANRDGVWNSNGAELKIRVLPPFYRTTWFVAMCVAFAVLCGWFVYRTRVGRLTNARFAQEAFSRGLINAHETERRRIAAELHDSIGQSLAMIKNRAVFNARSDFDQRTAREAFEEISKQSGEAIGEVREIAYNLRPYLLDRLGLTKAIETLLGNIAETGAIRVESVIDDVDGIFPNETEISIYRVLQESLSNVLKHSDASRSTVLIRRNEHGVSIVVEDDGRGFDPSEHRYGKRPGFGLLGMSERVRLLGGTYTIESEIGGGTIVRIQLNSPNGGK